MRVASAVELSDGDCVILLRWSRGKRTETRLVLRAKIVPSSCLENDRDSGLIPVSSAWMDSYNRLTIFNHLRWTKS
jgi:hypothetical protein